MAHTRIDGPDAALAALERVFVFQSRYWRPGVRSVSDLPDGLARLAVGMLMHQARSFINGRKPEREEAEVWLMGEESEPWYDMLGLSPACARRWIHDAARYVRDWRANPPATARTHGLRSLRATGAVLVAPVLPTVPEGGGAEGGEVL